MSQRIETPAPCRQESRGPQSRRVASINEFVPAVTANQNVGAPTFPNSNCCPGVPA